MPSKKTQSIVSPKETLSTKLYNPIDPNYVRRGVEDILRISHRIRLQQDTIINALNYSGPPVFPTAPTPQGVIAEAPVSSTSLPPTLYPLGIAGVSSSTASVPQVTGSDMTNQAPNFKTKENLSGKRNSPKSQPHFNPTLDSRSLQNAVQNHTGCSKCPPFNSTSNMSYEHSSHPFMPWESARRNDMGPFYSQIKASTSAPAPGAPLESPLVPPPAPVPKLPSKRGFSQIGDEFLRLLSAVANKKLKRNAPTPLNVTNSFSYGPPIPASYFPPSKHTFPYPSGYTGLNTAGPMTYGPVNAPVKLPPLENDVKNGIKPSGPLPPTLNPPVQVGSLAENLAISGAGNQPLAPFVPSTGAVLGDDLRPSNSRLTRKKHPINASNGSLVREKGEMINKDGVPSSGSSADVHEELYNLSNSTNVLRPEDFVTDSKGPSYQVTLKFLKNKPIPLGLLTGLSISPDSPGIVKSVAANNIPLNKPEIKPIDDVVKPGKKQPVLDVFINDAVRVAPMISQPPSAQLCYLTEAPEPPRTQPSGPSSQTAPQPPNTLQPGSSKLLPNAPPLPQPSKPCDVLHGSLYFKDTDAFNFLIYRESAKDSKKNFMKICEMAWDTYHKNPKPQLSSEK